MINLTANLCDELGLTYWQLKNANPESQTTITIEEKELLRNILLAKGINLADVTIEIQDLGIVVISLPNQQLIFNDGTKQDSNKIIHLAKLADMLHDKEKKKITWFKLKNANL